MKQPQTQNQEVWKDIPDYEGTHQVSNFGRVKGLNRKVIGRHGCLRTIKERILKLGYNRGYCSFSLKKNKSMLVHRAVAMAFLPNPENKPCVNHIDGNPSNNNLNNLEWCTYSENELHSIRVLKKKPNKTALGKFGILNSASKQLGFYDINGNLIYVFGGVCEAASKFKTNRVVIKRAVNGRFKSAYGYIVKCITREEYFKNIHIMENVEVKKLQRLHFKRTGELSNHSKQFFAN
jgi:hypothetical protein